MFMAGKDGIPFNNGAVLNIISLVAFMKALDLLHWAMCTV
jgi:hypothetical protein